MLKITEVVDRFISSYYSMNIKDYRSVFHEDMENIDEELDAQEAAWEWDNKQGIEPQNTDTIITSYSIVKITEDSAFVVFTDIHSKIGPIDLTALSSDPQYLCIDSFYIVQLIKNDEDEWKIIDYSLPWKLGRRIKGF